MTTLAYAGLWIFVFSMPFESLVGVSGVAVIPRATGALALGLALLSVVISGRFRRWHAFHVIALLFWLWAALGLFFANRMERLPYKFWTYAQLLLVLWMIWELVPSKQRALGLLTAYVFGAYVAVFGTIIAYRKEAGLLRRFTAGGSDPNDLAMTLALALPMAWYLGITYRQPLLRWACRAYLPVGLVAIGLTGSRGGMLASMIGLLIVPLSMTTLSPGRLVTAVAMLGISGALAVAYIPDRIVERLATTGSEVEDFSFGGRFKLWVAGVEAFTQRPVIGYGTGGFKAAVTPKLGQMSQVAHNSYVSVLVEQGVVGFLLYAMMFVAVFLAALNLPPPDRRFALVLLATLAIAMLPLTWEDRKPVWFILAALLALSRAQVAGPGEALRQTPLRPLVSTARPMAAPGSPPRPASRSSAPPIRTPRRDA